MMEFFLFLNLCLYEQKKKMVCHLQAFSRCVLLPTWFRTFLLQMSVFFISSKKMSLIHVGNFSFAAVLNIRSVG